MEVKENCPETTRIQIWLYETEPRSQAELAGCSTPDS